MKTYQIILYDLVYKKVIEKVENFQASPAKSLEDRLYELQLHGYCVDEKPEVITRKANSDGRSLVIMIAESMSDYSYMAVL